MAQTKQKVEERITKRAEEKKNRKTLQQTGKDGQGFADQSEGFALDEQVDKSTLSIKLLSEGYMQAYIDFFYLTEKTTPRFIEPSEIYMKEFKMRQARTPEPDKEKFKADLKMLRDDLIGAEMDWREGEYRSCFRTYQNVAHRY